MQREKVQLGSRFWKLCLCGVGQSHGRGMTRAVQESNAKYHVISYVVLSPSWSKIVKLSPGWSWAMMIISRDWSFNSGSDIYIYRKIQGWDILLGRLQGCRIDGVLTNSLISLLSNSPLNDYAPNTHSLVYISERLWTLFYYKLHWFIYVSDYKEVHKEDPQLC